MLIPTKSSSRKHLLPAGLVLLTGSALTILTGCAGMQSTATPSVNPGPAAMGRVHGGSEPVAGAHVYLFAVNTTETYGSASTSLLMPGSGTVVADSNNNGYVTSAADGSFGITADYACPTNSYVYLLAAGGNPGVPASLQNPTPNNSALLLMAAVGPCANNPAFTSSSFINLDEVSTVAAVTALQQFMLDGSDIGTPTGNVTGLANAFAMVPNMVDLATSGVRTQNLAGTAAAPQAMIDTLGNILASCVNSVDQDSSPSQTCTNLFTAVTPSGSQAPTDTVSAMLAIAKNPTYNTTNIFNLAPPSGAPYQPSLSSLSYTNGNGVQQNLSFTLGLNYTGGGLSYPGDVAIDASGSAYVISCPNCPYRSDGTTPAGTGTDSIVVFNPLLTAPAMPTTYTSGIHLPETIAIDGSGNIWTTNETSGSTPPSVQVFTPSQGTVAGFPYTTGLYLPQQVVIDAGGNGWISDAAASEVLQLSPNGQLLQAVTESGFTGPYGLAIDNAGDIFAAGSQSENILDIAGGSGSNLSLFTGNGLNNPTGLAADSNSNVWDSNYNTDTISEFSSTGAIVGASPFTPDGQLQEAAELVIDGSGNLWIPNCRASSTCQRTTPAGTPPADNLVELNNSGVTVTGPNGIQDPSFNGVAVSAIDASGNMWVTNNAGASVTELIGIATPVATPTAMQVATRTVGLPAGTFVPLPALKKAN